ncbi:unnamed protein product, partial [marine sediment metagenome]
VVLMFPGTRKHWVLMRFTTDNLKETDSEKMR